MTRTEYIEISAKITDELLNGMHKSYHDIEVLLFAFYTSAMADELESKGLIRNEN